MEALVIGGTRNLGPGIISALLAEGFSVTVLHRGQTRTELPHGVREVFADRADAGALRAASGGHSFDVIVDTTLYTGREAEDVINIFSGRVGRYVFLSTGAVFLVRTGLKRPYRESDYDGPTDAAPEGSKHDYESW